MNKITLTIPNPQGTPVAIPTPKEFTNFQFNSVGDVVSGIIPFVFAFAGIGLLIMLIIGGFSLLTSAGDAKKLEQGKQTLTYALVGFLIIFVAYWIVQILGRIFGLGEITTIFR